MFLPHSNRTFLSKDGVTELEGPGWVDKRPFLATVFDPFDLVGLIMGRDKTTKFWETEQEQGNDPQLCGENSLSIEAQGEASAAVGGPPRDHSRATVSK